MNGQLASMSCFPQEWYSHPAQSFRLSESTNPSSIYCGLILIYIHMYVFLSDNAINIWGKVQLYLKNNRYKIISRIKTRFIYVFDIDVV